MPIDYSKWKKIEVSDDEDDTHPNVDTPSLFRWRHQARLDRMAEQKKEKEELFETQLTHQRRMMEIKQKLNEVSLDDGEKVKLETELSELEQQELQWKRKENELEKKEKLAPWNVDTISHDGFSKSRINKIDKAKRKEELSEEQKEEQMREFLIKNENLVRKFGLLRKWDDSKQFLLDNPQLCCEEAANILTIECLNHQMLDKEDLMQHVAHQCIVMQYLLELAKSLDVSPKAPQLISSFFSKIKLAEKVYMDAFEDELEAFKNRIRVRAEEKLKEAEEEERRMRLGPGGLDPIEVFESLPLKLQQCFESKDIPMLQKAMSELPEEEARFHLKRCIDSGLWIPDAQKQKDEQPSSDENITAMDHDGHHDPSSGLRHRKHKDEA